MSLAILLIVLFLLLVNLINKSVVKTVNKLSEPESLLKVLWDKNMPLDKFFELIGKYEDRAEFSKLLTKSLDWTEANDFTPDLVFDFHSIENSGPLETIVWKNKQHPELFIVYYHSPTNTIAFEFSRLLPEGKGVATSSTRDALSLPRPPGNYMQVFEKLGVAELYLKHCEAVEQVMQSQLSGTQLEVPANTIYIFISAIKNQSKYIKTIPHWHHKGAYWYFVRRNALANKAISI